MAETPGVNVTWATLSAIAGLFFGLVALNKLAINPLEERILAMRERIAILEQSVIVRMDRFDVQLHEIERVAHIARCPSCPDAAPLPAWGALPPPRDRIDRMPP